MRQLTRIEGLPPELKPVQLSADLASRVADTSAPLGSTSSLQPAGERLTVEEAEADPRLVPHWSPPTPRLPLSEGQRDEARRKYLQAERLCQPADPRLAAFWCAKLRTLPFGPDNEGRSQEAIATIVSACNDLPGAVWTNENLVLALRTFRRWPSPGEVYALLEPKARPFWASRDGLRRTLNTPVATVEPQRQPPTNEAMAEVHGLVEAFKREVRQYAPSWKPPPEARSRATMSTGQLLQAYEALAAQGDAGAKLRVEMLRKQLAKEGTDENRAAE